MLVEPRRIRISPHSEIARLIREVGDTPVILESAEGNYRLVREAPLDTWEGYDPARVKEVLAHTAGSWADLDIDGMLKALYAAREAGSRPLSRP